MSFFLPQSCALNVRTPLRAADVAYFCTIGKNPTVNTYVARIRNTHKTLPVQLGVKCPREATAC